MKDYRYQLDRSSKKYICPSCGKMRFVRFIDTSTGKLADEQFGRCDREVNCGYFLIPSQPVTGVEFKNSSNNQPIQPPPDIPLEEMRATLSRYEGNNFALYLSDLLGLTKANQLIARYYIGTSSHKWAGATVFWFIDYHGRIRCGQVKLFNHDGHTAKIEGPDDEQRSCTTWIHCVLDREYKDKAQPAPLWLQSYLEYSGTRINCLFGEHLLKLEPTKPVAIVEAPATAIVASAYLPEFVWLASGSLSYLTKERCKALKNRDVVVFPDISKDGRAFNLWSEKAKEISSYARVTVSDYLEIRTTLHEKRMGLDLRDFVTKYSLAQFRSHYFIEDPNLILKVGIESLIIESLICTAILPKFDIHTFRCTDGRYIDLLFGKDGNPLIIENLQQFQHISSFFSRSPETCYFNTGLKGLSAWIPSNSTT